MGIKIFLATCCVGIISIGATIYFVDSAGADDLSRTLTFLHPQPASHKTTKSSSNSSSEFKFLRISAASEDKVSELIGPDTNKNFIRDDIDQYLDKTYPDPRQHAAMVQFTAAYGHLLVNGGTVAGAKDAGTTVVRAIQCGINVFGDSNIIKQKTVLAMMLNTEDRFAAFAAAQKNEEGLVFPRFQGEPCL